MAKIEDVAKAAGVSKSTVSNVFSQKRPISKEVTERVLRVAKQLNYRPNYWARSLVNKTTNIIGLGMQGETMKFSQFHLSLLNGVLKVCYSRGYRLLVNTLSPEFLGQVRHISSDPVDGEIILDPTVEDRRLEERLEQGLPIVVIGRPSRKFESRVSYVDNDNVGLTKQMVHHLFRQGHRNILFLNTSDKRTVGEDRARGFLEACREVGLEPDSSFIRFKTPSVLSREFGYEQTLSVLKRRPHITAIIADSDKMALGIYQAAQRLGLDIPEDLSVMAYGDESVFSPEFQPSLSGVNLYSEQLGEEAAHLLIEQLNNDTNVSKRVLVPADLVPRGSCGPNSKNKERKPK